mmetsp:Transcript_18179/g.32579  ORF Transcript_18179/g.32579 Transcript_18179/m.32579 type:complete len:219 (-) Transcript_18179:498-1154(-)
MTPKQFRRYWLKQKKRSIMIIGAAWMSIFAVSHSQVGDLLDYYLSQTWRELLGFLVPDYSACPSARETKTRVKGLDPAVEKTLAEWFLSFDRAMPKGVEGTMYGGPDNLTLNEFLAFASEKPSPAEFTTHLLQDWPFNIVEKAEEVVQGELERVRSVEAAYYESQEQQAVKSIAATQLATTTREIAKLKAKLKKYANDARLLHKLALCEGDLQVLKTI